MKLQNPYFDIVKPKSFSFFFSTKKIVIEEEVPFHKVQIFYCLKV